MTASERVKRIETLIAKGKSARQISLMTGATKIEVGNVRRAVEQRVREQEAREDERRQRDEWMGAAIRRALSGPVYHINVGLEPRNEDDPANAVPIVCHHDKGVGLATGAQAHTLPHGGVDLDWKMDVRSGVNRRARETKDRVV